MKFKIRLFLMTLVFISCDVKSQSRIQINIPSLEEETTYIWRTLQDINFFEKNNYQVSLPKGALIEKLKIKAKTEVLTNEDYDKLKIYVRDSVYNINDYQQGYEKINNQLTLINKMVDEIINSNYQWDFKEFKTYKVSLSLYGPGGNYNSREGSILIYTTPNGEFKQYDNPANTVIHEIIHIGIESSIINKYKVPHKLKERIVDTFVFLSFRGYLTNYRIQNMGEKRIDSYLKSKLDLKNLSDFVKTIMKSN